MALPDPRMMHVESAEGEPARAEADGASAGSAAGPRAHGVAALLLAGMAAIMALDLGHDSPTMDEKNHVLRGLAIVRSGDTRLSSAHPPLANLAQALPGALAGAGFDPREAKGWKRADINGTARAYLDHDYARARRDILGGRWVNVAITLAFGGFLYGWGLGRGRTFALALLGLYCAHPIVLAHGHLATTDLPFTAAYFVAIVALARYLERGGPGPLLGLAGALALAFVVKFSAVLLLPPLALGGAYAAIGGLGRFAGRGGIGRRLALLVRDGAALGLAVILAINAVYGFQGSGKTVAAMMARKEPIHPATGSYRGHLLEERSPIRFLAPGIPVPLPYTYVFGLAAVQAKTQDGHGLHIFGRSWSWFPLYFPALLLLKTSLGILALFAVGAAAGLRRVRRRWPSPTTLVMVAAPTTFLAVAALSRLNIGVRHALPVVPFMLIVAALGALALLAAVRRRWPRALGIGLLASAGAEALLSTPNHISHFSWAIGGDAIGHRLHMVGEDWGQDVAALAAVVEREGLGPLYYEAYGDTTGHELAHAGVAFSPFRCGRKIEGAAVIARHARNVARSSKPCPPIAPGQAPERVINHHILLYRAP